MSYRVPFADRTGWPFNTNPLVAGFEKLKTQGVKILDLTESNPTRCFQYPQDQIVQALHNPKNMSYAPCAKGMPAARQAVCDYYRPKGISIDPERIFLTSSTSEGYSSLFRLLLNPGDNVLAPRPSYPLFELLTDINDARIVSYPLRYDRGWTIDLEALEGAVTPESKAIIVVNPNNPTGSFLKKGELAAISRICRERGMALICDEVFSEYVLTLDDQRAESVAGHDGVLTFVLNGISKNLGLPQMKIGWILISGPAQVVNSAMERLEVILDTYLSVGTPAQNALGRWLELQPVIHQNIAERLRQNYELLKNIAEDSTAGFELLVSEGGWYAVLKLAEGQDEESLASRLLEKDHVFVHPGYFFDFEDGHWIVLSLLTPPEVLAEGVRRIRRRLQERQG